MITTLPACHQDSPQHAAYVARVEELEAEGCDTSDAQGIADMEFDGLLTQTKKPTKPTHKMKTEIKFQTIGTRAVVSKKITPEQAAEIMQKNPNITQVDTPAGYYPRDTMHPFALDHATGQLYKTDEAGKYHLIPKP